MPESVTEILAEIRPFAGESGTCSDETAFEFLNKARRLLWNKTDFPSIMDWVEICCVGECFYLPSAYKQIRLAFFNRTPVSIGNEWYQSIPQVGDLRKGESCHKQLIQVGGFWPTFQDYTCDRFQIGVQAESVLDAGSEITVFGKDEYGTFRKEVFKIEDAPTRVLSRGFYRGIQSVIKPVTKGRIRIYAQDTLNEQFLLLGIYQPYDRNPNFLKFKTSGRQCQSVTLYAKKKYFDLPDYNELVEFPTEAIKFAITAIVAQISRDNAAYQQNLGLALAEIQGEMGDQDIPTASPMRLFHNDTPEHLYQY